MPAVYEMTAADCIWQAEQCRAAAGTLNDPKRTFLIRVAVFWDRLAEYKQEKNVVAA